MGRSEHRKMRKQIPEITRIIGETIQEKLDDEFGTGVIHFFWDQDDPLFPQEGGKKTVLEFPAVNFYNPDPTMVRTLYSNIPVIKDKDENNLTAKEFRPAQTYRLRYAIRVICSDPDIDLVLQTFFLRIKEELPSVDPIISDEPPETRYVPLYWHDDPSVYTIDRSLKIRIYIVDAWIKLESKKFIHRRLIGTDDSINVERTESPSSIYRVPLTLSHTVRPGDLEVYVSEDTAGFPATGTLEFARNDENFVFTSRRLKCFSGSSKIQSYHFSGEQVYLLREDG